LSLQYTSIAGFVGYLLTRKMHLSETWLAKKSFVPTKVGIEIKRFWRRLCLRNNNQLHFSG